MGSEKKMVVEEKKKKKEEKKKKKKETILALLRALPLMGEFVETMGELENCTQSLAPQLVVYFGCLPRTSWAFSVLS